MKKNRAVFTLATPDYEPELCEITFPLIRKYADKLKAEFVRIETRKFPDYPITYERLQIHELGKDNEWNVCIDPDTLIHPDIDDFTQWFPQDNVGNWSFFDARQHFDVADDKYFARDGRFYGIVDSLVATSWQTHDLWTPLPETNAQLEKKIYDREWVRRMSEYAISRNLARYGMKIQGLLANTKHMYHFGATSYGIAKPADEAIRILKEWGLR